MAPRGAPLLLLLLLRVLPGALRARGEPAGPPWLWATALQEDEDEDEEGDELPTLSRGRRDGGGRPPGAANTTAGYPGTAGGGSNSSEAAWLLSSALPGTGGSPQHAFAAPSAAAPPDKTDPPDPDLLPGTNGSLLRGFAARTTTDPPDETDPPDPDLLPGTNGSLGRGFAARTTTDPPDETDPPDPDLLPGTNGSLPRGFAARTTTDPPDETNPPNPDLLPSSAAPSTPAHRAPVPGSGTEHPPAAVTDASGGPGFPAASAGTARSGGGQREHSAPAPGSAGPTWPGPRDAGKTPGQDVTDGLVGQCLLAIFILALVAATFIVCTAVLGTLLWRRQAGGRRLSRVEMVCISSLLPDGETPARGARPGPGKRLRMPPEPASEAEGDDLTLSSFLPDHS